MEGSEPNSDLRDQAVKSLNAKRDFMAHLATFVGVSPDQVFTIRNANR